MAQSQVNRSVSRRSLIAMLAGGTATILLAACGETQIVTREVPIETTVIKEVPVETIVTATEIKEVPVDRIVTREVLVDRVVTQQVEVEKIVTQIVEVEKVVEKVVEKIVEAAPQATLQRVEIMTPYVGIPRRQPHRAWMLFVSERLAEHHPNIIMDHKPTTNSTDTFFIRVAAGDPPNIKDTSGWTILKAQEIWTDLTPFIEKDGVDLDIYYPLASGLRQGDSVYGLPFLEVAQMGFYNITMLERKGVPAPTANWTWDEYLERAMQLRDQETDEWGHHAPPNWESHYLSWVRGAGGDYLSDDGLNTTLDTEEARAGLQFLTDMYTKHDVAFPIGDQSLGNQDAVFATGTVGLFYRHAGYIPFARETIAGKFDWDLFLRPTNPQTGIRSHIYNQVAWSGVTQAGEVEATWTVLKFLTDEVAAEFVGDNQIYPPGTREALLNNYLAGDPPPASLDLVPVARDEATDLKYVTSNWLEWFREIGNHITPALTGELTLDEAIANMIRNGDQILAQ